jgi:hypothetical protein
MNSDQVVARMTVTRKVGVRTIIEVHQDATFSAFYKFYTQEGRRRSTKKLVRTANRNEGLPSFGAHQLVPGLEILACRWMQMAHVEKVQVRIIKKKAYRRLINARPDELGMARVNVLFTTEYATSRIPVGPLQFKRVERANHRKIHAGYVG